LFRPGDAGSRNATLDIDDGDGTMSGVLRGVGSSAILEFTHRLCRPVRWPRWWVGRSRHYKAHNPGVAGARHRPASR
jgi:hypothetical protein